MANIVFGDYKPTEIEELDYSDPNIIDVEWLDENKNPIGTKKINGTDFSDVVYGQKVRIKVKFTNYDNKGVFISIESNNKKCKFKPKIPMMFVKNDEVLSEPFVLPINMYFDEIEEYGNYYTKVPNPQELYVTVLSTTTFKTKEKHILKPYTYFRNYEESLGLVKSDNSGTKDGIDNYENKFINYNTQIAQIVKAFLTFINDLPLDNIKNEQQIIDEVTKQAKALWNSATNQVQNGKLDDRPLYWARNKMQTYLKRHPFFKNDIDFEKSLARTNTKLANIITIFEEQSRNYKGIDFSKANGKKKVLITGFDPFQLDPKYYGFTSTSVGIETFNPSGISALALHNNPDLLLSNILVQVCIFPVRYKDVDDECVENIIRKHFTSVDLIMTTSRNHGISFDVEKYSSEYRGGLHDNMNIGNSDAKYNSIPFKANKSSRKIETTLPQDKIFGSSLISKTNILGQPISFDDSSSSTLGSGSNYLSNEVMYRATNIRDTIQSNLPLNKRKPVGHFHLRDLGTITKVGEVINVVKEIVKKIVL
jgi:hypothetical protein